MWGVKKYIKPLPIRFIFLIFFLIIIVSILFFKSKEKFLITSGGIITIAGTTARGYSGDGGPAINAQLATPEGVEVDSSDNIYIVDTGNHCIRRINTLGIITTIAGTGTGGFTGDNGPATSANINMPREIALDSSGNIYIADSANNRVRKLTLQTNGTYIISTIAGTGTAGSTGDNGPARTATFDYPSGVAVDSSGNIYISDSNNNRIRKVDTTGKITTVAGSNNIGYFTGNNGLATSASLNSPRGLAVDSSGNIYIAEAVNNSIRKLTLQTNGTYIISIVAGTGTAGFSGDDGPATSATLYFPTGIAIDSSLNIYISDNNNNCIRKVDSAGIITTVAGSNFLSTYTGIPSDNNTNPTDINLRIRPRGVAVDSSGNIYIADTVNNRIRKIYK